MNKSELLEKLKEANKLAQEILNMEGIKFKEKKTVNKVITYNNEEIKYINDEIEETDHELIDRHAERIQKVITTLTELRDNIKNRNEETEKKEKEETSQKKYDISKEKLLELLDQVQRLANDVTLLDGLNIIEKNIIKKIQKDNITDFIFVRDHIEPTDTIEIMGYAEKATKHIEQLTKINNRVAKIGQNKEKSEEIKKKIARIIIIIGSVIILTTGVITLHSCNKVEDLDTENTKPGYTDETDELEKDDEELEIPRNINTIDINNEDEFTAYAEDLKAMLGDDSLSVDDIKDALYLANFEDFDNKRITTVEQGKKAMENIGKLSGLPNHYYVIRNAEKDVFLSEAQLKETIESVSPNLDINDFSIAKTNKGYDLYALLDACIAKLNTNSQKKTDYTRAMFNFITCARITDEYAMEIRDHFVINGISLYYEDAIMELIGNDPVMYGTSLEVNPGTKGVTCPQSGFKFLNGFENSDLKIYIERFVVAKNNTLTR